MVHVIATRGLPASGKTTWARQFAADNGYKRWNNDEFSYMVTGITGPGSFGPMDSGLLHSMRRAFITEATADGFDVIVDNTNLSPYAIEEIEQCIALSEHTFNIKLFDVSAQECIARDTQFRGGLLVPVIKQMADRYRDIYDWI